MRLLAENLAKSYGETRAVDGVSITLEPGRVHALVGENGAGKSTTLRMLAGVERPDQGEMSLDGAPYAPLNAVKPLAVAWRSSFKRSPSIGL